ncbi:von Willebrand factor type A domain protein [Gloeomargarita lithophora Alchichica-D10]|uniref:von Willebrand factor type A domain protein n=1 Tax=Gloeomargarita lithophora Alchichica-D10 TaxID=1188229 RepID=A0A1J0AAI8_9CYAN|nr:VIT domain-containing protein [Gloeomargarita lithophora]APB32947.1 von Willebrand factor type A domain protein [Gloeomargarita lithophora Alchichica-D10]
MFSTTTTPSGLLSPTGTPIPLRGVDFNVVIREIGSWVTVSQHFQNVEDQPIEAVYSFPLPEGAAICGFQVYLGERIIAGRVEEKETAFAQYDEAIKEGHGAYLVDQDRPNIFTISVGNLLPQQAVVVRMTYVQELDTQVHGGRFVIPTTISPRYMPVAQLETAPATELLHLNPPTVLENLPYGLAIRVDLVTSTPIIGLESPSHPIRLTLKDGQATVELVGENIQLDQDFVLTYTLQKSHEPHILLGKDMGSDGFVAMLNFWPQLEIKQRQPQEFIFIIDRSGSMQGESIQQARTGLLLCLKSLQPGDQFNIYGFGSTYEKLFERSQPYTEETLTTATQHVQELEADIGGTEIYPVLENALSQIGNLPASVILLTDGEVGNEQEVIHLAQTYRGRVRIFAFGIGRGADEYLMRGMARATDGAAEFIFPEERTELKVMQQFHRIGVPHAEQVRVDWGGLTADVVTPAVWPPLFHNQRWTAYARFSNLFATTVRLEAVVAGQPYTWEVTVDPERVDETAVVPLLFARSTIRDWEEPRIQGRGSQQRDRQEASRQRQEAIVNLGCRYQLMSSETSFVAIEQRPDGDKTTEIKLRRVPIALTKRWGGTGNTLSQSVSHSQYDVDTMADIDFSYSIGEMDECSFNSLKEIDFKFLHELAIHQRYEGFWILDSWFVNMLHGGPIQLKQIAALLNTALEEAEKIIVTLFVLRFLKDRFADSDILWQSLAQKAEQWLRNLSTMPPLIDPEPVDVVERWQAWFAQQLETVKYQEEDEDKDEVER